MSGGNAYEVSLFGEFFPKDLKPILNRITLHSESSTRIHTREIVFRPFNSDQGPMHPGTGADPTLLRARKEALDENSTW
jgi:mediator of RNA polymerase II transcription subunit 18